MSEMVHYITR